MKRIVPQKKDTSWKQDTTELNHSLRFGLDHYADQAISHVLFGLAETCSVLS